MLNPIDELNIANSLRLLEFLHQLRDSGKETEELNGYIQQMEEKLKEIWGTLTDKEVEQVMQRYELEKLKGAIEEN